MYSDVLIEQLKFDSITGFLSRTYFDADMLETLLEGDMSNTSCLFADFNFLKFANDMHGYANVDKALKRISDEVRIIVLRYDPYGVIVRYGGDEVLVILKSVDESVVRNIKHDIQDSIKKMPTEQSLELSLAIGYSIGRKDFKFSEMLCKSRKDMKSDKEHIKSKYSVPIRQVAELIAPTIERMVSQSDIDEFLKELKDIITGK